MNGPLVSVLIPAYNADRYLDGCLASVAAQDYRNWEALVIDDGSTDRTPDVIEAWRRRDERIKAIRQANQGLAAARNTGLRHAKGEFVALLDADDEWLPHRLRVMVEVLRNHPKAALAHANVELVNEQGDSLGVPNRPGPLSGFIFPRLLCRRAHIACPTVIWRKSVTDVLGGFDEHLARLGCEDRELWCRINRVHPIVYHDEVVARYRVSAASMSRNRERMLQARLYVVDKHCPATWRHLWLRRRALSNIYRDMADEDLAAAHFKKARSGYWTAVRYNPLAVWAWINMVKTVVRRV